MMIFLCPFAQNKALRNPSKKLHYKNLVWEPKYIPLPMCPSAQTILLGWAKSKEHSSCPSQFQVQHKQVEN